MNHAANTIVLALLGSLLAALWGSDVDALAADPRGKRQGVLSSVASNADLYAGNTALGYSASGRKFRVFFGRDGKVVYDDETGAHKKGRWSITGDGTICYEWWQWTTRCYAHYKIGGAYHSFLDDKTAASTFIMRRGNVGIDAALPPSLAEIADAKRRGNYDPDDTPPVTGDGHAPTATLGDAVPLILIGIVLAGAVLLIFLGIRHRKKGRTNVPTAARPAAAEDADPTAPANAEDKATEQPAAAAPRPDAAPADIRNRIGRALRRFRKKDFAQARALLQEVLDAPESALPADHPIRAKVLETLGKACARQRDYRKAASFFAQALRYLEILYGPEDPRIVDALTGLAKTHRRLGQLDDAEPLLQRALEIRERNSGRRQLSVARILNAIGELRREQGRFSDAARAHARALAIREGNLKPHDSRVAQSLNNLALALQAEEKLEEAEHLFQRVLRIDEENLDSGHPILADTLYNLATVHWAQSRYGEAEPLIKRSRAILEKALGPDHPGLAKNLEVEARLHAMMDRPSEAMKLEQRVKQIRAKHPDWTEPRR